MTHFKIATWNVNSLRVRLSHVLQWLDDKQPDVLALQETKLPDSDFPFDAIKGVGYYAVASGEKTYNGVALLSRKKATDILTDLPTFDDPARRLLGVTIGDIRIINLYVPNGESITSAKYQYKLQWLNAMSIFLKKELKKHPNMIVLGDFNIAPEEKDVYNPQFLEGQVLCSEQERKAFQALLQLGFCDCFRQLHPAEKQFTWWDYRLNAFKRNMGLRIDHILATLALAPNCVCCEIDKNPRTLDRPSDHAPMIATFDNAT